MCAHRWTRLCVLRCFSSANTTFVTLPFTQKRVRRLPLLTNITLSRSCCHGGEDLLKHQAVQRHLRNLLGEYKRISSSLQHEEVSDSDRRGLNRRLVELSPVYTTFQSYEKTINDLEEVEALLQSTMGGGTEDKQFVKLLKEEQEELEKRINTLKRKLIQTLVPSDARDNSGVILEVVTGRTTGGDICQQFTREMFDMYEAFASYNDWGWQVFNYTPADYGGLHHAAVRVTGERVYGCLKFEGGTHRVQRIPETGLSSRMQRIHTGTMTVIVLPESGRVDVTLDPKDLRIDTFRSRGAGGQSVNTTDSAVRIVHLPTGTVAECQQSRSQLQNRDTALCLLKARLHQSLLGQRTEERLVARKQQVGTRCQSERIRTYNFSQDRVTDHRIGYVTRDIKGFMRGGELLEELIGRLQEESEWEALLELINSAP
ncbi:peptide chain release factor 1, mitochondrial [Brachyhypopomus gauderio]|uniref:peptide chain release factor 1, mitochondrial n=1 Tax=Brachyhypopomus gauderio TaxID=698409 RepID=UPI0040435FE1